MSGILRGPRRVALAIIAVLVTASTMVAFGESYRALYLWALRHGVPGGWALVWPAMVDTFVCVGELALFVALIDRWTLRSRLFAWSVTLTGLAVSIAGNIGHGTSHALSSRATAAVPPLAAAAALAVGLGVLKRVVERHQEDAADAAGLLIDEPEAIPAAPVAADAEQAAMAWYRAALASGFKASQRQIADQFGLPRSRVANLVKAVANGHAPEEN